MNSKLIIIGVFMVLLVGFGAFAGYQFINGQKTDEVVEEEGIKQQEVKEMKPEDLGLELTMRNDKKAVFMTVTKLSGIKSFDYEATFDAEVKDPESGEVLVVPRGQGGSVEIVSSDKQIKREVVLGTCSSGTCKYDKVVSDVNFLIRVNLSNGEIGSVVQKISL